MRAVDPPRVNCCTFTLPPNAIGWCQTNRGIAMNRIDTTRRTFLGGAASTAAVLGPLALVRGTAPGKQSGQRALGGPTPLTGKAGGGTSEMEQWSALIGQRVVISGGGARTGATLAFAKPEAIVGTRPKSLRAQPMSIAFALDQAIMTGDAIYEVTTAGGPTTTLFMQAGVPVQGAARLVALLN